MALKEFFSWLTVVALLSGCSGEKSAMENIVFEHFQRRPQMEPVDFYKLAFQATMGIGHFINDSTEARRYLESELATVDSAEDAPLIEAISPDGSIVRVNLRRFQQSGVSADALLQAMLATSTELKPAPDKLEEYLEIVVNTARKGIIPLPSDSLELFFRQMKEAGYPAVHHSEAYSQFYRPAYRVVLRETLPPNLGE